MGVSVAVQEEERQERERLRQEWVDKQEKIKRRSSFHSMSISTPIPAILRGGDSHHVQLLGWIWTPEKRDGKLYSTTHCLGGFDHCVTLQMMKGNSIYQFLQQCLENLRKEFSELR